MDLVAELTGNYPIKDPDKHQRNNTFKPDFKTKAMLAKLTVTIDI
jgi:hypothetical protein